MIDLRLCKRGDILISSQDSILEYVSPTPWKFYNYLDHVVRYLEDKDGKNYGDKCYGTRTHDGFVFQKNRIPESDHDIIDIMSDPYSVISIWVESDGEFKWDIFHRKPIKTLDEANEIAKTYTEKSNKKTKHKQVIIKYKKLRELINNEENDISNNEEIVNIFNNTEE